MNSLTTEIQYARAEQVMVTDDALIVDMRDGRTISVPLAWYPRLQHGDKSERNHWQLIGGGTGIHWPELDEDISLENLLLGKPSGESLSSLKEWLMKRTRPESTGNQ